MQRMGTNYYPHPGRSDGADPLHMGTSRGGGVFPGGAHPAPPIANRADWEELFAGDAYILDEYGRLVTYDEFLRVAVTALREHPGRPRLLRGSQPWMFESDDGEIFANGEFC